MLWVLRTTASFWNVPKKYGPYGEFLLFLTTKEPTIHQKVMVCERDTEDGQFSSHEEHEHHVENFVLCSFARHACSLLLQGCLHGELCEVTLTCHFSLDVLYLCQD